MIGCGVKCDMTLYKAIHNSVYGFSVKYVWPYNGFKHVIVVVTTSLVVHQKKNQMKLYRGQLKSFIQYIPCPYTPMKTLRLIKIQIIFIILKQAAERT